MFKGERPVETGHHSQYKIPTEVFYCLFSFVVTSQTMPLKLWCSSDFSINFGFLSTKDVVPVHVFVSGINHITFILHAFKSEHLQVQVTSHG